MALPAATVSLDTFRNASTRLRAADPPLILHVEDDSLLCEYVARLLDVKGYRVISAPSGPDALAIVRQQRLLPEVLIVDYDLGTDINGTEVVEAFAAEIGYVPPIIMLTANPCNAEVPWTTGAPFWLVSKPCNPRVLLAGVSALVQFRRAIVAAESEQRSKPAQDF